MAVLLNVMDKLLIFLEAPWPFLEAILIAARGSSHVDLFSFGKLTAYNEYREDTRSSSYIYRVHYILLTLGQGHLVIHLTKVLVKRTDNMYAFWV